MPGKPEWNGLVPTGSWPAGTPGKPTLLLRLALFNLLSHELDYHFRHRLPPCHTQGLELPANVIRNFSDVQATHGTHVTRLTLPCQYLDEAQKTDGCNDTLHPAHIARLAIS
jgi:hypothetical protein